MTRNTVKSHVMLMVLTLLISVLAGCSGSSNKTADNNEGTKPTNEVSATAEATAEATAQAEDLSPLTLSFFAEDPNPNWNNMKDDISKVITEKTGVTLDAEFAVGDPQQKIALIAAGGDYPDIISAKADIGKLVDAGAIIDLTELIDKYAPNIKRVLGDNLARAKYTNEDQSIYAIPTWAAVDEKKFVAGGGFELQHRVLKEAGYPEIRTVTDYENVIKAYLEKHPTDENGNKNIGVSLNADDWHMYISVTNPAVATTGGSDDGEYYVDQQTHEAIYHFRRPEEERVFPLAESYE